MNLKGAIARNQARYAARKAAAEQSASDFAARTRATWEAEDRRELLRLMRLVSALLSAPEVAALFSGIQAIASRDVAGHDATGPAYEETREALRSCERLVAAADDAISVLAKEVNECDSI